jgi:hypothetical protein
MIKVLRKLGIEGMYLNIVKAITNLQPTSNLMVKNRYTILDLPVLSCESGGTNASLYFFPEGQGKGLLLLQLVPQTKRYSKATWKVFRIFMVLPYSSPFPQHEASESLQIQRWGGVSTLWGKF